MAITYKGGGGATNDASAASLAASFSPSVTAGSLLVAVISYAKPSTQSVSSISDTLGNTWTVLTPIIDTTNQQALVIAYAMNSGAGANTVTVNYASTPAYRRVILAEYSGVALTSALDVQAGQTTTNTTATDNCTSTAATTTAAGDLIVGGFQDDSHPTATLSAGTGFTKRTESGLVFIEDMVQTSAGSKAATATFGTAGRYIGLMAAFKAAVSNTPPVANAGPDQTGVTPGATVTLTSSASTDPDGTIASRAWTHISGPTSVGALSSSTATSPTYTAPAAGQTDVWRVTVTDNLGGTNSDDVSITTNATPVANAGPDQTGVTPGATVTLTSASSSDPDGTIASRAWTHISGPTSVGALSSSTATSPTYTAPAAGSTDVWRVTVTDNLGLTSTDDVSISTSAPAGSVGLRGVVTKTRFSTATTAWVINLPAGVQVGDVVEIVTATPGDHTVSSYPSGVQATKRISSFDDDLDGVWDADGDPIARICLYNVPAGPPSTVTLTMAAAVLGNAYATAYTGVDTTNGSGVFQSNNRSTGLSSTIPAPSVSVGFTGGYVSQGICISGNGLVTGPSGAASYNSNALTESPASGVAAMGLQVSGGSTVSGNFVNTGPDSFSSVWTHVLKPVGGNVSPVANAGPDQVDIEPFTTVTLAGSASDPDGTVASKVWSKVSGPTPIGKLSSTTSLTPTFEAIATVAGATDVWRLTVTDNLGAVSTDDVTTVCLVGTEFGYAADGSGIKGVQFIAASP